MNSPVEMMKFNGYMKMKVEIERLIAERDGSMLSMGRQVHMLCTTIGLLVFIPKSNDITYIHSKINGGNNLKSTTHDRSPNVFGSFEKYLILPANEVQPLLLAAHTEYHNDFKTIRNAARNSRDFYNLVQESRMINYMRLTRQIRFICTGMMLYGTRPSIRAFQFMYTIMSFDVLLFGRYYEDSDKEIYNAMDKLILETEAVKLGGDIYTYPTVIDVYQFKRCNLQSKGSILLMPERTGPINMAQKARANIPRDIDDDFKNEGVGLTRVISRSSVVKNVTNSFSHESALTIKVIGAGRDSDIAREFATLGAAANNIQLNANNNNEESEKIGERNSGNEIQERSGKSSDEDDDWSQ